MELVDTSMIVGNARLGNMTGGEKRRVLRVLSVLDKSVRTAPDELLIMEVEMFLPENVVDIRTNKRKRAEAVLKLIKQLKDGPLRGCKTDEEYLKGAIEFLVKDKGKAWGKWLTFLIRDKSTLVAYKI